MIKIKFIASKILRIDKTLINYFKKNYFFSKNKIIKLIKKGNVIINYNINPKKTNYIVKIGDKIIVNLPNEKKNDFSLLKIKLNILYEDNFLLVIDKPNNLVVHPAPGHYNDTLVNILLKNKINLSTSNGEKRPGIVHRIDKQTTGTIIIAKNNIIHKELQEQIKLKKIQRYYLALVHGKITENKAKIDAPIGRDNKNRKKMMIKSKNSKKSITNILVIERFNSSTYIKCKLESGRTHQIRVHLKYINHPIIGDPIYGINNNKKENFGQYLHAYKIKFIHPVTKKNMIITSKLPKEFVQKLYILRVRG